VVSNGISAAIYEGFPDTRVVVPLDIPREVPLRFCGRADLV
jgi:hypothetical protein